MSHGIVGPSSSPSPSPSVSPVNLQNLLTTNNSSVGGFKWRLLISYDGTRYSGWQYQKYPPTIQCAVEEALTQCTNLKREDLCLVGASRTDRGVHATGQVAHYITPFNFHDLGSHHAALNGLLPCDIRITEVAPALPQFHARFSVQSKVYHYNIYNGPVMDPFMRLHAYHSSNKLNTSFMREAAKYFLGTHDFSAFANAVHDDGVVRNPVKNILRFDVNETGELIQLQVEGSGFLYRQVRNMVALVIQIGKEALPPDIVPMILESRDRRELAKYTFFLPPHGLCLESIKFKEEHLQLPPGCTSASVGRHHTITKCKLPLR